jgi:hypothetical protein
VSLTSRAGSSSKPRTVVGQWLRAGVLGDLAARRALSRRLNGGSDGWNDDEPAVVEIACESAVRRFFGSDPDVREITAFVSDLRDRVKGSVTPISQLEAEAVIRSALGEDDVDISDLRRVTLFNVRSIVTVRICLRLGLGDKEVNQLIADAERTAFERGWKPPLADS